MTNAQCIKNVYSTKFVSVILETALDNVIETCMLFTKNDNVNAQAAIETFAHIDSIVLRNYVRDIAYSDNMLIEVVRMYMQHTLCDDNAVVYAIMHTALDDAYDDHNM